MVPLHSRLWMLSSSYQRKSHYTTQNVRRTPSLPLQNMLSLLRATQVLLGVNLAVSIYTTWYLFYNNGTAELMEKVRDVGPRTLPGSNEALKTTYVGIGWIDNQLTLLTLFFWETVDGARPAASLFSFMFAGQGAAAWTILSTEGRRFGNHWKVVSL